MHGKKGAGNRKALVYIGCVVFFRYNVVLFQLLHAPTLVLPVVDEKDLACFLAYPC